MSKSDDYTTRQLLDYLYHQKYYKRIVTELSRKTNTSISQQINFVGTLEEEHGATMKSETYKWKGSFFSSDTYKWKGSYKIRKGINGQKN